MKKNFEISGMSCSACSARIESVVGKAEGVKNCSVNLLANSMQVEYNDNLNEGDIIQLVQKAGYDANVKGESKKNAALDDGKNALKNQKHMVIASFLFMIPLSYIAMGSMMHLPIPNFLTTIEHSITFALIQMILASIVMLINYRYFIHGFKNIFYLSPNMDSLIALGSGASFVYGLYAIYKMGFGLAIQDFATVMHYRHDMYFETSAMIVTLISLGKYFEAKAKYKTGDAIRSLMDLSVNEATVIENGQEVIKPIEDVNVGDICLVKAGQSVPVDGIVLEGTPSIDEAFISGESIPVDKNINDKVYSATLVKSGYMHMRATKVGSDTTFNQIIELVEQASASKAPIAQLADKVSGIFVPSVIAISFVTFIVWIILGYGFEFAFSMGISVLVISCPCALGLATPTAIMVATGKGAQNGILIKSGEALEVVHAVDTVVFDKTGTITLGKPKVCDIKQFIDDSFIAQSMASLEAKSNHPLAMALNDYFKENNVEMIDLVNYETLDGLGLKAVINGKTVLAGNRLLMEKHGIDLSNVEDIFTQYSQTGATVIFQALDTKVVALYAIADTLKDSSNEAMMQLKAMGLNTIMLTGDNQISANAIASKVGVDQVIAQVLPSDKEAVIDKLQKQGKKVAMVGDGINDAPALVKADVGLAIGAGSDVAIESADLVLMHSDLLDVVKAIQLSKAVIKNIKENLFWAFFYNTVGIPIAAGLFFTTFGLRLNPMIGAAAMSLSSVCVVTNALRLRFFKPKFVKVETINKPNELKIELMERKPMMKEITLKVEGMMCQNCVKHVTKALNAIEGVNNIEVSLENGTAKADISENVQVEDLLDALNEEGYPSQLI